MFPIIYALNNGIVYTVSVDNVTVFKMKLGKLGF